MSGSLRHWASSVFTLDLRSLALFRMALGLVVVADCAYRSLDVEFFYSDLGVKPRADLVAALLTRPRPSLHLLSGAVEFQALLLGLAAVAGLLLVVGWRTRLFTILAWVLVLSLQNRHSGINTGADAVLVSCLLFGCFLPLGARLSLDAARAGRAAPERLPREHTVATPATAAFVVQLVVIYVFNVLNKFGKTWWNGTAVLQALHIDQHTTVLGHVIRDHFAWLSWPLTFGTLLIEVSAVLLLLPWAMGRVRTGLVAAMWGLHIGLAASMYLGLFSPVCMAAWLAVLPASAWARRPLSTLQSCDVAPERRSAPAPRVSIVAAGFIGLVIATQVGLNVLKVFEVTPPLPVTIAARAIGIDQLWRMFSANPSRHDGWFVLAGELASGDVVDLMREGAPPLSWQKPRYVAHLYKTARWRKFMMNNSVKEERPTRKKHAEYLCRTWNSTHDGDQRLEAVAMTFMLEMTRRDFGPRPTVEREDMGRFLCAPPAR